MKLSSEVRMTLSSSRCGAKRLSRSLSGIKTNSRYVAWPSTNPVRKQLSLFRVGGLRVSSKYKEVIYDLYLQGYSVFIADHRGQGLSDRVLADEAKRQIGYVRDFQDYVSDLRQLYTDIVRPTGHKSHVLLGHSMGGCIASLYLETFSQDFDLAVLCSPMDELALGFLPRLALDLIRLANEIGLGEEYAPDEHGYDEAEKFSDKCLTHSELRWNIIRREFGNNPAAKGLSQNKCINISSE
jgi:alpha-beta hydrolase superfamily lysophospholipase